MDPFVHDIIIALTGGLLGGGFMTFLQFLITRHDNKVGIVAAVKALQADFESYKKENKDRDELKEAKAARRRIIRFKDELQNDIKHSQEMYNDILDDITYYDNFCKHHEDFPNGRTIAAEAYIRKCYDDLLEKHEFSLKELHHAE